MASARVARGRKTQELLAEYYRQNGWPDAEAVAASLPGRDIKNMLGLAPEVKATERESFPAAVRQARANSDGDVPYVIYRPRGYGPERIDEWLVIMRLDDHVMLVREAGYGTTD